MGFMADFGQGFLSPETLEGAVEYFNAANLKGGVISIIIGAVIYFVLIRKWISAYRLPYIRR